MFVSACVPLNFTEITPTVTSSPTPPSVTVTPTATVVWFPPTATFTPFPTMIILPTVEQRPGIGEVLFEDDFSDASAWTTNANQDGATSVTGGMLTIAISQERAYLFSLRSQPVFSDFYAEITASPSLCRGADEYGMLIRVSTTPDYYRFSISCDGQARLDRIYGGQASSPQPWVMSGAIPLGGPSTSRLGVWAAGPEMRFFVNDEYLFTVKDPLLSKGGFGVFARSGGDMAVTVNFSDLVIRGVTR